MSYDRRGLIDRLAEGYLTRRGYDAAAGARRGPVQSSRRPDGRARLLRRLLLGALFVVFPVIVVVAIAAVFLVAWLFGNADSALGWVSNILNQIAQIVATLQSIGGGEGGG